MKYFIAGHIPTVSAQKSETILYKTLKKVL
jgi:hypothetical protein